MTPVIVIIIEPELEFDDVEPGEAPTSIGGGLSLLAEGELFPVCFLFCLDLFPKKRLLEKLPTPFQYGYREGGSVLS